MKKPWEPGKKFKLRNTAPPSKPWFGLNGRLRCLRADPSGWRAVDRRFIRAFQTLLAGLIVVWLYKLYVPALLEGYFFAIEKAGAR